MPASIRIRVKATSKREKETDTMVFMDRHVHPLEEYDHE
jgi:hypothetical protein